MIAHNLEQGTEAWHEWRKSGVGSSDANIIMGVSEFATPYELFMMWTGRKERPASTFATELGHRMEPHIRRVAEAALRDVFEPHLHVSDTHPFMIASLDGQNFFCDTLMEIKLNNEETHEQAMLGELPDKHKPQVQHQLFVTQADRLVYVSCRGSAEPETLTLDDLAFVWVDHDEEYQAELIQAEAAFIECLASDTPPPKCERDHEEISNPQWTKLSKQWSRLDDQIKFLKKQQDAVKEKMVGLANDKSVVGCGVKLTKGFRRGNVAYKKIPELKGVDLDQYRGAGSVSWTVSKEK